MVHQWLWLVDRVVVDDGVVCVTPDGLVCEKSLSVCQPIQSPGSATLPNPSPRQRHWLPMALLLRHASGDRSNIVRKGSETVRPWIIAVSVFLPLSILLVIESSINELLRIERGQGRRSDRSSSSGRRLQRPFQVSSPINLPTFLHHLLIGA